MDINNVHVKETDLENRRAETLGELDKEYFQLCNKVFPGVAMFRFEMDMKVAEVFLSYVSSTWPDIMNVPVAEVLDNIYTVLPKVHVDDMQRLVTAVYESIINLTDFKIEVRYFVTEDNMRDIYITSRPQRRGEHLISDGFLMDITGLKKRPQADKCACLLQYVSDLHISTLGLPK